MRILIGCDVDPILPDPLARRPPRDPWRSLAGIEGVAAALPPVTWLIRADESVNFAAGGYDSGYLAARPMWEGLRRRGHELGWHMHLMSPGPAGAFRFDPEPEWLERAHAALARHFPVTSSRTGWDYGSAALLGRLDALGIQVDFSALPGTLAWFQAGGERVAIDWLRCPAWPYHPSRSDYQRPGADALSLLEVPIAQFPNPFWGRAARLARRLLHGCFLTPGLSRKTRLITRTWPKLPPFDSDVLAFFFHPDELTPEGTAHLLRNLESLGELPGARFVTARELRAG